MNDTTGTTSKRTSNAIRSLRQLAAAAQVVALLVAVLATWNLFMGPRTMERHVAFEREYRVATTDQGPAVVATEPGGGPLAPLVECRADVSSVTVVQEWAPEALVRGELREGAPAAADSGGHTVCDQMSGAEVSLVVPASRGFRAGTWAVVVLWCAWVMLAATMAKRFAEGLDAADPFAGGGDQARRLRRGAWVLGVAPVLWLTNWVASQWGLPVASFWLAGCGLVGAYLLVVMAAVLQRGAELRDDAEGMV